MEGWGEAVCFWGHSQTARPFGGDPAQPAVAVDDVGESGAAVGDAEDAAVQAVGEVIRAEVGRRQRPAQLCGVTEGAFGWAVVALWCCVVVVLWRCGVVALWCFLMLHCVVVLWCCDVLWCCVVVVLCRCGVVSSW